MSQTGIVVGLVLAGLGSWIFVEGVRLYRGTYKSWFYVRRTPTIVMPNIVFGALPFGGAFVLLGLSGLASHYGWLSEQASMAILGYIIVPLWGLGVAFWLWKPRLVQPSWYRWLDDHYGHMMPVLKKDAERLGKAWVDRVRTQEGLEQWAEEVRLRHQSGT